MLKEEVNQMKTQMNLIIQILLRKEEDPSSNSPQAYAAPQPWVMPSSQQQPLQQRHNGYFEKNQSKRKNARFDPVPIPLGQILPYLIHKGMVEPKPLKPMVPPYPPYFDVNARCGYHAGSPGHNIENCRAFKYKVQELVDCKLLSFKKGPPSP
jgi:hypothetical protein